MSLFKKPLVRVLPGGGWEVDIAQTLSSEKGQKDLQAVEDLYQRLKAEGHDVRIVAGRHSEEE